MTKSHFDDPEFASRYVRGPSQFLPGYEIMQRMAAQLLAERAGPTASILVLGAGGGLETHAFARFHEGWTFTCVDPAMPMIEEGKRRLADAGMADRAQWTHGYIADAPHGPFDAASCLLTLHFAEDNGEKLRTLRGLRERLKPGGRLALVDLCIDMKSAERDRYLDRYTRFALDSGAEPDDVAKTRERLVNLLKLVPAEREEQLLDDAGFANVDLFYAGLSWRGWVADATPVSG